MKLPKDLELALRYLLEVVRAGKVEMYVGSSSALTDAVMKYIKDAKELNEEAVKEALFSALKWTDDEVEALFSALKWTDDEVVEHCLSTIQPNIAKENGHGSSRGVELLHNLENSLLTKFDSSSTNNHEHDCSSTDTYLSGSGGMSPPSTEDSGIEDTKDYTSNGSTTSSNNSYHNGSPNDDGLCELLRQLQLRKIERFEPTFPIVSIDSDDDDGGIHVDEESEERSEKFGSQTCEEEVERRPDGHEIRMKKTRIVNKSQTSKSVTIRTHGGGQDDIVKKFRDGSQSFNDDADFETSDFFKRNGFRGGIKSAFSNNDGVFNFDDAPQSPTSPTASDLSQKLKSLQHASATLQSVSKQNKRDGKIIADNAAHKLDTAQLDAKQTDTYQGNQLLDRKGEGSYEESSIMRMGLPGTNEENSVLSPIKRNVVQFVKTIGDDNVEGKDNYFKATTLASYITLNDNLRFYEEQQRKKVTYTFGTAGTTAGPSYDYINLKQLLQVADTDELVLPRQYVDEVEETEIQKSITFPRFLQITDKPSILESLDVAEFLVLRAKDSHSKPTEVRGGPKDALLVYATQPGGSLLFQEAFLATYRSFVTSAELIQKLVKRYLYMSVSKDLRSTKAARQTFSVLVRVVDELCIVELTRELINTVTSFVYRLIRDGNYDFARLLRKRLMERLEDKASPSNSPSRSKPDTPLPVQKNPALFECRTSAIAKQITLLDSELFYKIEPAEMLWWAKEQDSQKSPNVVSFTEHFNRLSYWARSQVILPAEQREREKYLLKFIKIMKQLRKMGNLNSYLAILSALESAPIRRLDWPKSLRDQLDEHAEIIDSKMSFKNYRTLLSETPPPCLPYIGLILQDLTFVDVGNPDHLPPSACNNKKNLLNYGKRWQQFAILDNVRRFKSWSYDIQRDEKISRMFNGFRHYYTEDEMWNRSFEIKPRKSSGR
uniref:Uncharacterized protein n=1 Tax=Acrobeloides nanus TaxID=290746 RepID=A0A914C1R6_9BILA